MVAFFFREVRIDPLRAKPGFLFSPAQAFRQQDFAYAAAFNANLLLFVQVSGKSIQAPAVKG
jgi:hypothetical protein